MIISERIFYVMEQKNITQLELSRRTGIATSNISDWKKKKTNPKADCLISICDALEITADQLLTGKGIDPECKDADMSKRFFYDFSAFFRMRSHNGKFFICEPARFL